MGAARQQILRKSLHSAADRALKEDLTTYLPWIAADPNSPQAQVLDDEQASALTQLLIDISTLGRTSELLRSLQQLRTHGICPTPPELADIALGLLKKPMPLSAIELEIVNELYRNPIESSYTIVRELGLKREVVESNIRGLIYGNQVSCRALLNYHALGLKQVQFCYKGELTLSTSPYFLSRYDFPDQWHMENWAVPAELKDTLFEHYRKLEKQRNIHHLAMKNVVSQGTHLSLASYRAGRGWTTNAEIAHVVIQRALAFEHINEPSQFTAITNCQDRHTSRIDSTDIAIIQELYQDYPLGQPQKALATRLGMARSTLQRRLQRLKANSLVQPCLAVNMANMAKLAVIFPLSMPQLLQALTCLPVLEFYISEQWPHHDGIDGHIFAIIKCSPATAGSISLNLSEFERGWEAAQERKGKKIRKLVEEYRKTLFEDKKSKIIVKAEAYLGLRQLIDRQQEHFRVFHQITGHHQHKRLFDAYDQQADAWNIDAFPVT
ncbi:MAG: winged helix-turn-helix transcriptional regulator [Candidatus Heimdallarchaeota archaeon]